MANEPTNKALYARKKAQARQKFDKYTSAYANAWLVREYKKAGGGYKKTSKKDWWLKAVSHAGSKKTGEM